MPKGVDTGHWDSRVFTNRFSLIIAALWQWTALVSEEVDMARLTTAALLVLGCGVLAGAQALKFTRYNIDYDSNSFRQDTPKAALASVLRALNERRVDYLLAQLTDPEFVDEQVVRVHAGKFDELVRIVKTKFANDPELMKNLVRFSKEGEWDIGDTAA